MNYLIDVNHPAQIHYFRNLYHYLKERHRVIVTAKAFPLKSALMSAYDIEHISYGKKKESIFSKGIKQVSYDYSCYNILKSHDIDYTIGASVSNVHASQFTKAKSISTTDSDMSVQPLAVRFVYPFSDYIMMPDSLCFQNIKKQICYPGYQELAYLHPNRFYPDPSVLKACGLKVGEVYFILRFTAFKAHHDIGMYGLSIKQKWDLIKLLEPHGRVMITSEVSDPDFMPYAVPISPEKIHSLMYDASMLICDSQTMTTESAILGTPAFRCNTFAGKLTVIEEIEKVYDLAYSYHPRHFDWMIRKIKSLLAREDYKAEWAEKRKHYYQKKLMLLPTGAWLLENAPSSLEATKKGKVDFDQFR